MLATFPQKFVSRIGRATSGTANIVPKLFPVAIDGRPFLIDEDIKAFEFQSIQTIRQQADTSERPGESTINPESPWARSQESWHLGAGQSFQDRKTSSPYRFRTSKGIDIHTPWEQKLLHDTNFLKENNDDANLDILRVGDWVYLVEGTDLSATDNPLDLIDPLSAAITPDIHDGESISTIRSTTTDGFNIWAVVGDGIHTIEAGDSDPGIHLVDNPASPFTKISYQKGHLLATDNTSLYDIVAAGLPTPPTALFTHPNPQFRFTAFAAGSAYIYAAGYVGDKSTIYRITITDTGAELDAPTIACSLPDGEIIYSLDIYEDQVSIGIGGEADGVHLGIIASDGSIVLGATIPTESPVLSFEPQGRFVFYGLTNFDSHSTGLGRMNLRYDTSDGAQVSVPSYASDLMADGNGEILGIISYDNHRIFAVNGLGFIRESDNYVESGYLETGSIGYDLSIEKLGLLIETLHVNPIKGSYSMDVKIDNGDYTLLGTKTPTSPNLNSPFSVGQQRGHLFEFRLNLMRDTNPVLSPIIQRITFFAYPIADTGWFINVPIIIGTKLSSRNRNYTRNPLDDLMFIAALRKSTRVVTLQFYSLSIAVIIKDFDFKIMESSDASNEVSGPKGTMIVQCKSLTS